MGPPKSPQITNDYFKVHPWTSGPQHLAQCLHKIAPKRVYFIINGGDGTQLQVMEVQLQSWLTYL